MLGAMRGGFYYVVGVGSSTLAFRAQDRIGKIPQDTLIFIIGLLFECVDDIPETGGKPFFRGVRGTSHLTWACVCVCVCVCFCVCEGRTGAGKR